AGSFERRLGRGGRARGPAGPSARCGGAAALTWALAAGAGGPVGGARGRAPDPSQPRARRPARGRTPFARRAGPDRVNPGGHHRVAACPRTPPHGAASGGEDRPRRGAGHAWWPWRPATATGLCRPDGSRPADRASVVVAVVQHLVAD